MLSPTWPYTLAYARDGPGLSAAELENAEHVSAASEQGSAAVPAPAVASEARQAIASTQARKGVLWSTLAAGMCVLGAMAWQLYRQLKRAPQ